MRDLAGNVRPRGAVSTYDPFDPESRIDPYGAYQALRAGTGAYFHVRAGIWFVGRYAEVLQVLRDPRFSASRAQDLRQRADVLPVSMLTSDPPEHTRLRRAIRAEFTGPGLGHLAEGIRASATALVDSWGDRDRVDLVGDFAIPLAAESLGSLLGVPREDLGRFRGWAAALVPHLDPLTLPPEGEATIALEELLEWFADALGRTDRASTPDVLGAVVRAYDAGELTPEEALSTCTLLVIGGFGPLVDLLSVGAWLQLREGPGPLAGASAIEETLRYDAPIQFAARVALEDVRLGHDVLRAGEPVVALLGSANRDPTRFDAPDVFDPARTRNAHLAFGAGPHHCLGSEYARLVARIAFTILAERVPNARLAADPPRRDTLVPRGISMLAIDVRAR